MTTSKLSAERARELFNYDPETGILTWKVAVSRKMRPGAPAGCSVEGGYIRVGFGKALFGAHRLAWLITTGKWPEGLVDHRDGDPSNNKFGNLRDATARVNQQNLRKARSNSATGFLGVFPARGKFKARIRVDGTPRHLGTYTTPEEAHQKYLTVKRELHAGCTI